MKPAPLVVSLGLWLILTGCSGGPSPIMPGAVYPAGLARGATLDIQVIRRETAIELTNTTARKFGASRLWLNGRFSRAIEGLGVGQTIELPLSSFRDEFSEAFRGGGFFATEKPDRLVLAELESGGELMGLIVVASQE
jgi:hypothetical protein